MTALPRKYSAEAATSEASPSSHKNQCSLQDKNTSKCSKQLHRQEQTAASGCSRAPEPDHRQKGRGVEGSEAGSLGLTCISSSFDWMSGGKSAAPQVNGSNGSAPNRSLSAKGTQVLGNRPVEHNCRPLQANKANDGQRGIKR